MAIFPTRRAFLSGAATSLLAQPRRAEAQAAPVNADLSAFLQSGAGAVTRSIRDKLREIEVNINDFGAVPHDRSKAADNYLAIRRALQHVLTQAPPPHLEGQLKLSFGAGEYFIAGTSPLMFNRSQMAALAGAYPHRRGLTYQGTGRKSTILTLVSNGNEDRWFYSTEDRNSTGNTSVADWLQFDGITFRGTDTLEKQTAGRRTNGFYWESYGFEKFINFSNCSFERLDCVMDVNGHGNVDHNCFTACNFYGIRDALLRLNNNQSVAWKFLGCDAEAIIGRVIEIGPRGGGHLTWIGGSITLYPEISADPVHPSIFPTPVVRQNSQNALVYWDNSGVTSGPSSGPQNGKFTFHGIRFEIYSAKQALVFSQRAEATAYGNIDVTFVDCAMPMAFGVMDGSAVLPPFDAVALQNGTNVRFIRCSLHHALRYVCTKHAPRIRFEDCEYLNEMPVENLEGLAGRCSVTGGTGTIQARGTYGQRNIVVGDYSKVMLPDFNKGQDDLATPFFSGQGKDAMRPWPQPNAVGAFDIYLPAGTLIHGFLIDKPAERVGSPTADAHFKLTRHDGTTVIGSPTSPQCQNEAVLARQVFATPYRVPAAPNNYVKLVAAGADVATPWAETGGALYLDLA